MPCAVFEKPKLKIVRENKIGVSEVYHAELYGKRTEKFEALDKQPSWKRVELTGRMLYFAPKNTTGQNEYEKGIKLDELFPENVTGIVTMGDNFIVGDTKEIIAERVQRLTQGGYEEQSLNREFGLGKNYAKWVISNQRSIQFDEKKLTKLSYRPFDNKWTYFDNKLIWRWRENVMRNFLDHKNLGLVANRRIEGPRVFADIFITDSIADARRVSLKETNFVFPLYVYADDGSRIPNLKQEIVQEIEKIVGKTTPEDIFDYIYAVLHSPSYREKYKEFLKIDFPRVPYPKDKKQFAALAALGRELRELHLLESPKVRTFITTYPESGSDAIEKITRKGDSVYINATQYFGNVPEVAWTFYIGGYQPAQKWLKDRVGRTLTSADIEHYQKIIVALTETHRLMQEIDHASTLVTR